MQLRIIECNLELNYAIQIPKSGIKNPKSPIRNLFPPATLCLSCAALKPGRAHCAPLQTFQPFRFFEPVQPVRTKVSVRQGILKVEGMRDEERKDAEDIQRPSQHSGLNTCPLR